MEKRLIAVRGEGSWVNMVKRLSQKSLTDTGNSMVIATGNGGGGRREGEAEMDGDGRRLGG